MSAWWQRRMVAFDVETTSPEPEEARIVSAAVVFVGGGSPTFKWSVLVNPGVEIPQEAIDVHGITNERAQAEGRDPQEALIEIGMMLEHRPADSALIICNAPFDMTVGAREMERHGLPELRSDRIVDPLMLDRHLDRYRKGSRKLLDTCEYYGIRLDGAHDATFDAIAAARLALWLGKAGKVTRQAWNAEMHAERVALAEEWATIREDIDLLHEAEQRWYRANAIRLQEYFRTGNPKKDVPPQPDRVVPTEWPVFSKPEAVAS